MPLREELLKPIPGENPSGADLRYDNKLLLYDKIKEARRQDDEMAQGEWAHERKLAQYPQVIKLAQDALAEKTKDLQLAAWLTEALLHTEGFAGLRQGVELCLGLSQNFWDSLYPPIEDGDAELRAAPLEWMGSALIIPLKQAPLTKAGYSYLGYKDSRALGYEIELQGDKEKKKERDKKIADGKLAPEEFDKAFVDTPKAFYAQAEKDLEGCLATLISLDELTTEKCGDVAPSFTKLKEAIEEVHHTVHTLLDKKRETEPDPVEEIPAEADGEGGEGGAGRAASSTSSITISVLTSSEPPDRREAIASVAKAAAFLRKREPHSPAPYLMMRGLRWGELRAAARLSDPTLLEGPPTELRQQLKRYALAKKWNELLEAGENAMSLPCSRGWLDLQRLVVEACDALGSDYEPIAAAIRSEICGLLHDVPELLHANLLDDTPAANDETRAWIGQLRRPRAVAVAAAANPAATASDPPAQPDGAEPASDPASAAPAPVAAAPAPVATSLPSRGWPAKATDSHLLAQHALQEGHAEKAIEIMSQELARQRSGRGRFQRTLQLVEICVAAGKDAMAQPLLDDLVAAIEEHKLDGWEDTGMVASALATVMNVSAKVKDDAKARQQLFERICRLDPVRAASMG